MPQKPKEPEINKLKVGSMKAWNTGESAMKSALEDKGKDPAVDKSHALKEVVRQYQEGMYSLYLRYIAELGALGYCLDPSSTGITGISEVTLAEQVTETGVVKSKTTYGERCRNMQRAAGIKRPNDNFEIGSTGSFSKKPKSDNGWGDDDIDAPSRLIPKKSAGNTDNWSDEEGSSKPAKGKGDHRKPINHMSTGWSDEEAEKNTDDRFGRNSSVFDRFRNNNDGGYRNNNNNDGGYRGRGGGGGFRGRNDRGRGRFGDRTPRGNGHFNNFNTFKNDNAASADNGWSDDEDKGKKSAASEPKIDNKKADISAKTIDDDDWNTEEPKVLNPATPAASPSDWQ